MENLQEKPDLLAGLEPDAWRNPASTNADYAFDFIRSASYCDPLYSRPKVESLLAECRKEARKEALLEAAEKLGKGWYVYTDEEGNVVRYAEDELRRMAEGEKHE